jgi:RNA polymerase sigma factor (sigma-70 family)
MAKAATSQVLQLIRRVVEDQRVRHLSDQDLLRRFTGDRDEAAFHALLSRHGPMVLDVCRSVLRHEADAEDAFQATFLVLAKKAGSICKLGSAGSWLHGVAYRTARKARLQSATRRKNEARTPPRGASEPDDFTWREVREVLHEELAGLSERYRVPLLVCYLEGRTQDEAAAQLGVAISTLKERLERGRSLLRARLVRRGLRPAALVLAAAWPEATVRACLPVGLVSPTISAACLLAAGQETTSTMSAQVVALTEGVLKAMFLTKVKITTPLFLCAILLALGATQHILLPVRALEPAGQGVAVIPDSPKPPKNPDGGDASPRDAGPPSVLVEHKSPVTSLAWSAEGHFLAAGTEDGTVHVTEAATGKDRSFATQDSAVTAIALSPDGKALEIFNKLLRESTWEAATGKQWGGHFQSDADDAVDHLAFLPGGKWAVGVRVGGFSKRQFVMSGPAEGLSRGSAAHGDPCCAAVAPDGTVMAYYDRDSGRLVLLQSGPADKNEFGEASDLDIGPARCIALAPGGKLLAVGGEKGVWLWDLPEGTKRQALSGPVQPAARLAFSANGKALAALSAGGKSVLAWDLTRNVARCRVNHERGAVGALALSPDGRMLATTVKDGKAVFTWKLGP